MDLLRTGLGSPCSGPAQPCWGRGLTGNPPARVSGHELPCKSLLCVCPCATDFPVVLRRTYIFSKLPPTSHCLCVGGGGGV